MTASSCDKTTASYDNLNFAIFRIVIPYIEGFNDHGPATRDQATANFYVSYMRQHVFEPVGINDADCKPDPATNPALVYPRLPIGAAHVTTAATGLLSVVVAVGY